MEEGVEIFKKVKSGDLKAFNQLFKSFYPSLCSVANTYIKDEDKCRDIAQEVFINLWNKRDDYDSIISLKTFLYVSVKNACLNHIRDKREENISDSDFIERLDSTFDHVVIEEETIRIIHRAIDNLPEQSSKIMKLVLMGAKNAEIAERLGISVNSVKTLKYNSLKTLKGVLKDYYYILLLFLANN